MTAGVWFEARITVLRKEAETLVHEPESRWKSPQRLSVFQNAGLALMINESDGLQALDGKPLTTLGMLNRHIGCRAW
jgi:hypothetical protein